MTDLERKAMEMALERLESHEYWMDEKAIQALRQALAQPEQDELLKQGWRQCAVGQRTTQYCGMAEQARLEEQEACAKVCEEVAKRYQIAGMMVADECATSIRARSNK